VRNVGRLMKAYKVQVHNQNAITMLAENEVQLFDRLMHMIDADDPLINYMSKYSYQMVITPLGEVV
jgi:hypothetical protein